MGTELVWAIGTGLITAGVWIGIVLFQRQNRLNAQTALLEELNRRMDQLEAVNQRLDALEERSDFAERVLTQQKDPSRLPPSAG